MPKPKNFPGRRAALKKAEAKSNAQPPVQWILFANRAGAHIFEREDLDQKWTPVKQFKNPKGKLPNRELDSDRPGKSFASSVGGKAIGGHQYGNRKDSHEVATERFTKELAVYLSKEALKKRYNGIFLVAEPHFLGILRKRLDKKTRDKVLTSIPKDVESFFAHEKGQNIYPEEIGNLSREFGKWKK
jgi:protein required for attachment to host cells